jgi:GDSL-like Lipase/Acylhydrolase family
MSGSIPIGTVTLFDASQASTIRFGGSPATDGGLVDTAGNMTQVTTANQPTFDTLNVHGFNGLILGGGGQPNFNVQSFLQTAGVTLGIPFTIASFGRCDGNSIIAAIYQALTNSQLYSNIDTTVTVIGPGGTQIGDALGQPWNDDNRPRLVILSSDGTSGTSQYVSDINNTGLALQSDNIYKPLQLGGQVTETSSVTSTVTVGANHAGTNQVTGAIGLFATWARVLSSNDRNSLFEYCQSTWGLPIETDPQTRLTQCIGDSLTAGWYTTLVNDDNARTYSFCNRAFANLGSRFGTVFNLGVGGCRLLPHDGYPIEPVITQWTTTGVTNIVSGMVNVVSVQGGINDLDTGETGVDVAADMATVVSQVVSDLNGVSGGPHHIFVSTVGWQAGFEPPSEITNCNNAITATCPGLGTSNVHVHVIQNGSDTILGDQSRTPPGTTLYFHDTTHTNKPGDERWSGILMAAILSAGL